MKLREVRAQNIRNFGPDALPVRFTDEATGLVLLRRLLRSESTQ